LCFKKPSPRPEAKCDAKQIGARMLTSKALTIVLLSLVLIVAIAGLGIFMLDRWGDARPLAGADDRRSPYAKYAHDLGETGTCKIKGHADARLVKGRVYQNVLESGYKYAASLANDRNYYLGIKDQCVMIDGAQCVVKENIALYFLERRHAKRAKEAIVLIHGNSTYPDGFFGGDDTYLLGAGTKLFEGGYDVFAPYITSDSEFQIARRRLASMRGENLLALDSRRVALLLEMLAGEYDRIHVAGVSYGGFIAVDSFRLVKENGAREALDKMGAVLSIEGWSPSERWADLAPHYLFTPNYERLFYIVPMDTFLRMAAEPNVFFGNSSCRKKRYDTLLQDLPADARQLRYTGFHSMRADVVQQAVDHYNGAKR
jgi:hypothetical protein